MKKLLLISLITLITQLLPAQNTTSTDNGDMQKWMAYMTPAKEQAQMAQSVGEWKATTKLWMDPSQPPVVSDSKCKSEMVLGGRYLSSHYTGSMMGMPFEGTSTIGFDNAAKIYVTSWIDNMGTGMMYLEGKRVEGKNQIEFRGKSVDPMTGKDIMVRETLTFTDADNQVLEMYMIMGNQEMKTMEVALTRVK